VLDGHLTIDEISSVVENSVKSYLQELDGIEDEEQKVKLNLFKDDLNTSSTCPSLSP
jgi:hypothetical protein